jgi:HEPN pEK499 p136
MVEVSQALPEFARRSLHNLQQIRALAKPEGGNPPGAYEQTQLIMSLMMAVVLPFEHDKKGARDALVDFFEEQGNEGKLEKIFKVIYPQKDQLTNLSGSVSNTKLDNMLFHFRNAIAHFNILPVSSRPDSKTAGQLVTLRMWSQEKGRGVAWVADLDLNYLYELVEYMLKHLQNDASGWDDMQKQDPLIALVRSGVIIPGYNVAEPAFTPSN